ncbi:MAG: phosphorylase family protein [Rhodospirillales bacterium]
MIGVVTGLKSEIAALGPAWRGGGFAFFAAGGSAERAEAAARDMAARGAKILVSAGLAGGLDPAAGPGDIVLAEAVIAPDGRSYPADAALRATIGRALAPDFRWSAGAILGCDAPVLGAAAKAELHRRTGAVAVDMESHGVARAAAENGLPLVVLRAIADPAGESVPEAALAGMRPDGSTDPLAVLLRSIPRPWILPGLLRLAGQSRRAHAALGHVALAAGRVLVG